LIASERDELALGEQVGAWRILGQVFRFSRFFRNQPLPEFDSALSFRHPVVAERSCDGSGQCIGTFGLFFSFAVAAPVLGAMMIFDRQMLPVFTSLGGRHASSGMQLPAFSWSLKTIAIWLAVWAVGVCGSRLEATALPASTGLGSGDCYVVDVEPAGMLELSQDVLRAPCQAILATSEASGSTVAQPKRTVSLDKLGVLKTGAVRLTAWDSAAAARTDRRSLDSCSLIQLHIRLQV